MQTETYWAIVTDNADPDKLNRVRVSKPGEKPGVTDWLPVVTPYASVDAGLSFIPEIGDQVLVINLEREDIEKTVLGTRWFNKALPPETGENTEADLNKNGENTLRFIKSRSGSQLIFDDTEGKEKIQLITADNKTRLEFGLEDNSVRLTTEHDIKMSSEGSLSFGSEKSRTEITGKKSIKINSGEVINVDAKKSAEIKAGNGLNKDVKGLTLN